MANFYGVRPQEVATSINTPIQAESGITIAVGTAPVHQVNGAANQIVTAYSYEEAVSALGYSEDWEKYTLCEVIYNHFKLYSVGPLLLVNVLDPSKHKQSTSEESMAVTGGQVRFTGDVIPESIVVKKEVEGEYIAGQDYDVFYEDGVCILEILPDGEIGEKESLTISYDTVDFNLADLKSDVIGGFNAETGESKGLELVDMAYFQGRVLPDILIAPGFSHLPEVASVMAAKTTFSTVFRGICICDIDTEKAKSYQKAAEIKNGSGSFTNAKQVMVWPMLGLGDLKFHYSTQLAGLMCSLDAENDNVPSNPIGNKTMQADCACLADGTQILLDLTQANYLRGQGIVTAYNFVNGFTSWGAYTGCYPMSNDPKDIFINETRMFNFVSNTVVLSWWSRIDERMTPRYAESIIDGLNLWLTSLVNDGHLLGARCEYRAEENPVEDLIAGIVRVHIYMTPAGPAQEIDFLMEYDIDYVSAAFGGGEE